MPFVDMLNAVLQKLPESIVTKVPQAAMPSLMGWAAQLIGAAPAPTQVVCQAYDFVCDMSGQQYQLTEGARLVTQSLYEIASLNLAEDYIGIPHGSISGTAVLAGGIYFLAKRYSGVDPIDHIKSELTKVFKDDANLLCPALNKAVDTAINTYIKRDHHAQPQTNVTSAQALQINQKATREAYAKMAAKSATAMLQQHKAFFLTQIAILKDSKSTDLQLKKAHKEIHDTFAEALFDLAKKQHPAKKQSTLTLSNP